MQRHPVIAIDPGPTHSALVVIGRDGQVEDHTMDLNEIVRTELAVLGGMPTANPEWYLVIEQIASYGMPVGKTVFQTVFWSGRFAEVWQPRPFVQVPRIDVKMHLCHNSRAKDTNIRQALIDRFGPSKRTAIGLKATPGPLYGFKGDLWAALAVGLTWQDKNPAEE